MIKFNKIIGFLFLTIFTVVIFNYVLFISVLQFEKSGFRNQLFSNPIMSSDVEILTMTKENVLKDGNGIEWHDDGKELSLKGQMYEVIKITEKNGQVKVVILKDEKENAVLDLFFAESMKSNSFLADVLKLLSFDLDEASDFNFNFSQMALHKNNSPSYTDESLPKDHFSKIIKPPCSA